MRLFGCVIIKIRSEVGQRFQIICYLFRLRKRKVSFHPWCVRELWHDERLLTHDIMTSVRQCARLCWSWHICPGVTLFITTASLCKLNAFARGVRCGHRCWDGRWCISGCGRDRVIRLAVRAAMFGAAPGWRLVLWRRCQDWPVEGGHSLNLRVRASSWEPKPESNLTFG